MTILDLLGVKPSDMPEVVVEPLFSEVADYLKFREWFAASVAGELEDLRWKRIRSAHESRFRFVN